MADRQYTKSKTFIDVEVTFRIEANTPSAAMDALRELKASPVKYDNGDGGFRMLRVNKNAWALRSEWLAKALKQRASKKKEPT